MTEETAAAVPSIRIANFRSNATDPVCRAASIPRRKLARADSWLGRLGLSGFGGTDGQIRYQAVQDLLNLPHQNLFEAEFAKITNRAITSAQRIPSTAAQTTSER